MLKFCLFILDVYCSLSLQVDDKDVSELGQTATVALLREKPIGSMVTLIVIPGMHREQSNPPTFSTSEDTQRDGAGPSQNVSKFRFS